MTVIACGLRRFGRPRDLKSARPNRIHRPSNWRGQKSRVTIPSRHLGRTGRETTQPYKTVRSRLSSIGWIQLCRVRIGWSRKTNPDLGGGSG